MRREMLDTSLQKLYNAQMFLEADAFYLNFLKLILQNILSCSFMLHY